MRFYGDRKLFSVPSIIWALADVVTYYLSETIPAQGVLLKIIKYGLGRLHPVLGGVMLFIALAKIAARIDWKQSKILSFLSMRNMTIYLFHEQFIYITILLFNGILPPAIHGLVNFVVSVVGASAISIILYKSPRMKMLIGEK